MPTTEELIEEYKRKREKILQMAKPETIEKRHKGGQWTARERIEYFFDPGNVKGMGPGVAEMEFEERAAETIIIFMADKTSAGAWNMPLYKMFADPFNTIGLVIAANISLDVTQCNTHDILLLFLIINSLSCLYPLIVWMFNL